MHYNTALDQIVITPQLLSVQQQEAPELFEANQEGRAYQVASAQLGDVGMPAYAGTESYVYVGTSKHPHLAPVNAAYDFHDPALDRLLSVSINREWERRITEPRRGVLLMGPAGVGKSTYIVQRHALQGIPVARLTWNPSMCAADAVYTRSVIDGTTVIEPGVLWQAMVGGYPVTIDEIDLAAPGELASLNELIDTGTYVIPESGEIIRARRGFVVHATCNSRFTEDRDGGYAGTRQQNIAVLNRFYKHVMDYPTVEQDIAFIVKMAPDTPLTTAKAYATFVSLVHKACDPFGTSTQRLSLDMGRRTLLDWLELSDKFSYLAARGETVPLVALGPVYSAILSDQDKASVKELWDIAVSQV